MSLGFNTESAILPKKSKEIKINPSLIVGLNSLIAEEEQKSSQLNGNQKYIRKNKTKTNTSLTVNKKLETNENKELKQDSLEYILNKGKEKERNYKDILQGKKRVADDSLLVVDRRDVSYSKYNKNQDSFSDNDYDTRSYDDETIDIDAILQDKEFQNVLLENKYLLGYVMIIDSFGRYKWVKEGSYDHMINIGQAYRIKQFFLELQNQENKQLYKKNHSMKMKSSMMKSSSLSQAGKIKMAWEHGLNEKEKQYQEDIHNELFSEKNKPTQTYKTKKTKKENVDSLLDSLL